ncbi:hypothetical protein KQI63_06890 [bacterium]|nr:hypothetical protein [bacterium]
MTRLRLVALAAAMLLLGFAPNALHARIMNQPTIKGPSAQIAARPSTAYKVHDVGTMWTAVSNFGNYGEPNTLLPSGEWPAGSEVYYIWEGRFWLAAMIGGEPFVSHADYGNYELDPTDGSTFYFGTGPKSIQDGWSRYDDLNSDIGGHTVIGYEVSQRSLAWSLSEYDDFVIFYKEVKNVSGGQLNGAFMTYVFDNDVGSGPGGDPSDPHLDDLVDYDGWTPPGENTYQYDWVDPLDLDGDGVDGYDYWGWPKGDPRNPFWNGYSPVAGEDPPADNLPEHDGIYDEYQIFLTDKGDYIRYQVSWPDEGIVAGEPVINHLTGDTLRGYLLSRNMSYMFDGDYPQSGENDAGERHLSTPVSGFIGTRFLYLPEGSYELSNEPGDTLPRPYSHQWWNWESDPGSDREKYEYMTGQHSLSAGQKFMPHPFDYGAGAPVFDYRYMISAGPINGWEDQEVKKFVMVTSLGWGLKGLRENVDNAMVAYYRGDFNEIGDPIQGPDPNEVGAEVYAAYQDQLGFYGNWPTTITQDAHFKLPIPPQIPDLHYSAADKAVDLVWDSSAETAIDNFLGTPDFEGYKIYRSKYNAQTWELIAAFDVAGTGPTYLFTGDHDTLNPITTDGTDRILFSDPNYASIKESGTSGVDWNYIPIDLPDIVNRYSDTGGTFAEANGDPIFENIEIPVNGLKYFYTVVAYDPDKPNLGLTSIESAKSNYRKTLDGAPDPVIPRPAIAGEEDLSNVKVVPNPYKGTALFESRYEDRVSFVNLPARCKISIFSMTGDLIDEITKTDATTGAVYWDLISRNDQKVVSGLYIYAVETPGGEKKIGKFLIIR